MATERDILEIITVIAASKPQFSLTKETIKAYTMMLKDLDADELKAAAMAANASTPFFPSVYEIRKAAAEHRRQASGIPSVLEAWNEVTSRPKDGYTKRVIEGEDGYTIEKTPVPWSHPFVERVAYLMGWPEFPSSSEIGVDRAHFTKAYNAELERAMSDSVQLPQVRAYIESKTVQLKDLLPKGTDNGT